MPWHMSDCFLRTTWYDNNVPLHSFIFFSWKHVCEWCFMNSKKIENIPLYWWKLPAFLYFLICFLISDKCFQPVDFLFFSCQSYILTIAEYTPIMTRPSIHIHPYLTHTNEWVKSTVLSDGGKSNTNHYKTHDMKMLTQCSEAMSPVWAQRTFVLVEILMIILVLGIVFFEIGQLESNSDDTLIAEH